MDSYKIHFLDEVIEGERELLFKALSNYKLDIVSIGKKRSVYKIIAKEGIFCLKRMKYGEHKVKNGYLLTEELINYGFTKVANYVLTINHKLYTKISGYIFYMTTWIDGKESKLNEIKNAEEAVKLLAEFHLSSNKINKNKLILNNNHNKMLKSYASKLKDFEKYLKAISNKILITEADKLYHKEISYASSKGNFTLELITSSYYNIINSIGICHDSFYYQNIISVNDNLYLIDLDSLVIDIQVIDLAKLIRRLMYNHHYAWDFNKAKVIIEAYSSIKAITKDELSIILSVIAFPHRFWKLGKKRYIKGTKLSEIEFSKKLNKIIKYKTSYELFIEDFLKYIDSR